MLQVQFCCKAVDVRVFGLEVQKTVKTPQVQYIVKIIIFPVAMKRQAPIIQTGQRMVV